MGALGRCEATNGIFEKFVAKIEEHWRGILSFFDGHLTQGPIEAINGIIKFAKRRTRGFRKLNYLRAIVYWIAGKLTLNLPLSNPLKTRSGTILKF